MVSSVNIWVKITLHIIFWNNCKSEMKSINLFFNGFILAIIRHIYIMIPQVCHSIQNKMVKP